MYAFEMTTDAHKLRENRQAIERVEKACGHEAYTAQFKVAVLKILLDLTHYFHEYVVQRKCLSACEGAGQANPEASARSRGAIVSSVPQMRPKYSCLRLTLWSPPLILVLLFLRFAIGLFSLQNHFPMEVKVSFPAIPLLYPALPCTMTLLPLAPSPSCSSNFPSHSLPLHQTILLTGTSSGLGFSLAHHLFLVRREPRPPALQLNNREKTC